MNERWYMFSNVKHLGKINRRFHCLTQHPVFAESSMVVFLIWSSFVIDIDYIKQITFTVCLKSNYE